MPTSIPAILPWSSHQRLELQGFNPCQNRQTFGVRGPSKRFVKRRKRRIVPHGQFQIDGIVERQVVFLGQDKREAQPRLRIGADG